MSLTFPMMDQSMTSETIVLSMMEIENVIDFPMMANRGPMSCHIKIYGPWWAYANIGTMHDPWGKPHYTNTILLFEFDMFNVKLIVKIQI